jgi:hypothetical protein
LVKTVEQLLDQIRHMKGVRDIWEVAVKRNGMTTSLALLGGVLVADMCLYSPKKRQAMQQNSSSMSSSGSPNSSSQQADSSHRSSSEHRDIAPRLSPHGVLPAHA